MILLCCVALIIMITVHPSAFDQYLYAKADDGVKQLQDKPPDKQSPDKPKQPPPPPVKKETTLQWLLRCLGISSTPTAMKGEDDNLRGDIWLTDTTTQTSQRLTREGGYRSPIVMAGSWSTRLIPRRVAAFGPSTATRSARLDCTGSNVRPVRSTARTARKRLGDAADTVNLKAV